YSRILETIAAGAHTRRTIAGTLQLTPAATQHYLEKLQTSGVVEHRLPLSRSQSQKRQGRYHIADPFLRFWHRWVAPHLRLLEINQRQQATLQEIRLNLPYIVAPVWETIAQQYLLIASGSGSIPFSVQEIGSWWQREAQIDVVGINRLTKQVVFGEVRWRAANLTMKDIDKLVEKSLLWLGDDTSRWDVHYAFFARSFGTIDVAGDEQIHLFTPADVTGQLMK
ncbi:MAG: DUF234 domain-containing protein, partial [Anaerolineae bacterium]